MLTFRSQILAEAISMYKVSAWTENSDFMDQISSKKEFQLQLKFQLKLTILTFPIKFAQKRYFQSKTERVNTSIEFSIFDLL